MPPLTRIGSFLRDLARRPAPSGGALLPALDALRGVAVLAVFAQHLGDTHLPFVRARITDTVPAAAVPWILTVLHHAHWGVDLFFVLSGFSLAQPLLARLSRAHPSDPTPLAASAWRASFFRRRAARIYPAYLAALGLVVVAVPSLARHPAFPASALAHLALLQGYVTPGGLALIGAAWSLTTEATFYVAWPFLAPHLLARPAAAATPRPPLALPLPSGARPARPPSNPAATSSSSPRLAVSVPSGARPAPPPSTPARAPRSSSRPYLFALTVVVLVWLTRGVLHELALRPGAPSWFLEASQRRWAVSRLDQFVLGAIAATLHARLAGTPLAPRLQRFALALVLASGLALTGAFYLEGSFYGRPLGSWPYALVSIATTGLVLASVFTPPAVAEWLFPKPLRAVGVVSYGVFLHHQLALGATAAFAPRAGTWAALACHAGLALGLSLLLGWVSWVVIERPVIEWATRREGALSNAKLGPPSKPRAA